MINGFQPIIPYVKDWQESINENRSRQLLCEAKKV